MSTVAYAAPKHYRKVLSNVLGGLKVTNNLNTSKNQSNNLSVLNVGLMKFTIVNCIVVIFIFTLNIVLNCITIFITECKYKTNYEINQEGCKRPVNPLRVLMIAEEPLEINAYIERGDGNGLGIVKTKAVINQNWQVASTQVSFTPGLIGLFLAQVSIQRISDWISSSFKTQF